MSKSNAYLLLIAVCAIGAALWYRQQVFSQREVPTTVRLAFVTGGSGPFWQLTANGARAAAEKYQCELDVQMPEDDENLAQQMTILSNLRTEKLDGIALSPLSAEEQTQRINRLQEKLKVATFDADAPLSNRRIHVGTSNYAAGRQCAGLVEEAIPDGGKVLVLLANLTKDNMLDRKSGFEDGLAIRKTSADQEPPQLEIVGFLTDQGDSKQTGNIIEEALAKDSDLACIVGMNARHGPVILETLKEQGKLGEIKVIAFDEEEETLDGIESGYIYATIAQNPYMYGYEAVKMICSLCQ